MATSSADCGANGYCIWEWQHSSATWELYENHAKEGFVCNTLPTGGGQDTPDGTLVITCPEPSSS